MFIKMLQSELAFITIQTTNRELLVALNVREYVRALFKYNFAQWALRGMLTPDVLQKVIFTGRNVIAQKTEQFRSDSFKFSNVLFQVSNAKVFFAIQATISVFFPRLLVTVNVTP